MAVAENLYHTTLTVVDYHTDASGSTQTVYILGSHATLAAAQAFATSVLQGLGYARDDFAAFEVRPPGRAWRHGDGVVVFAKARSDQELLVGLLTTPNNEGLVARPNSTLELPHRADHLQYVVQHTVDYERDRSGAAQTADIEGCYLRREDAVKAARECLAQTGLEFARYDERKSLGDDEEWPYGEDVLVHAIAQTGENLTVAIRTPPEAYRKNGKHLRGRQWHGC